MHQIAGKKSKKILSSKQVISKELELENLNLKIIFNNLNTPVCLIKEIESKEFFYESVNKAFASLNNKDPRDYNGKPLKELLGKDEYAHQIKSLQKAKRNGIDISEEKGCEGKQGKIFL